MIGWYAHHHGRGHVHRALALAAHLAGAGEQVTVLSSTPRPADAAPGTVAWVELPRDDDGLDGGLGGRPVGGPGGGPGGGSGAGPVDPTAHGHLHWVPRHHDGLRERTAAVSAWIAEHRPRAMVVDVSQEVALLARLHGVPVVSTVLPGDRTDAAHALGLGVSDALVGFWPAGAGLARLPAGVSDRLTEVGALSRFDPHRPAAAARAAGGPRRATLLGGRGGDAWTSDEVDRLTAALGDAWELTVLGSGGAWVDDPWTALSGADVVLTHAGQNALAEVASARRPAVVVPAERPHEEQRSTGRALATGGWPVQVLDRLDHPDWPGLLDEVAALDGAAWARWCDGRAGERFAEVLGAVLAGRLPGASAGTARPVPVGAVG